MAADANKIPRYASTLEEVDSGVLDTADYLYADKRDVTITIEQPEFTSVCPKTGLPDFGCIRIEYCPLRRLVELKSLKYYLLQYRNVGVFYEHVTNRILDDLVVLLEPKWMRVTGTFTPRGGIKTTVKAEYEK